MATNRIDRLFQRCKEEERPALILFLTSGFPTEDVTRRILPVLEKAGCDLLELGVPFSDPIADGPTIQQASTVALRNGMTLDKTLAILSDFRRHSQMPCILFGAYNPFFHRGVEAMTQLAVEAGADGFLAADLPLEEAEEFRRPCRDKGLHLIPLIAPTSSDERVRRIADSSSGFLYCMSLKGITGARDRLDDGLAPYLDRVRSATALPVAVGFGISTPQHVAQVAPHVDGVVVGSALIKLIDRCVKENLDLEAEVESYVRSLVAALRPRAGQAL